MQRWYQPCMQQPKPRKEAFSGCGCEAADVARAPTIHEGLVVFTGARGGGRFGDPRSARFLPSGGGGGGCCEEEETNSIRWLLA